MQLLVETVKGQTGVHILDQQSYYLRFERAPGGTKQRKALSCLFKRGRLKDRVSISRELLPTQSSGSFIRQLFSRDWVMRRWCAIAEGPLKRADLMHHTTLLFGVRQFFSKRLGQPCAAIA